MRLAISHSHVEPCRSDRLLNLLSWSALRKFPIFSVFCYCLELNYDKSGLLWVALVQTWWVPLVQPATKQYFTISRRNLVKVSPCLPLQIFLHSRAIPLSLALALKFTTSLWRQNISEFGYYAKVIWYLLLFSARFKQIFSLFGAQASPLILFDDK